VSLAGAIGPTVATDPHPHADVMTDRTTPLPLHPRGLLGPWRRPGVLWRALAYVVLGVIVGAITFAVTVTLLASAAGLLVTFVLAIPFAWLLFVTSRGLAGIERSRAEALLDARILDAVPPLTERTWLRRLWERVRSAPRWREIGHHLLALPVGVLGFVAVVIAWCGSLAFATLPAYVSIVPDDTAKFWVADVGAGPGAGVLALVGVAGLVLVAPWVTVVTARWQLALARTLLGTDRTAELEATVGRLETSRSAAVDSAETERRRIERDLHDGAQQRLVALAASLGEARELAGHDPAEVDRLVAGAHEEAKAALKEIRDLVRGIHPVILEDRGLDAALSAVVARAPVPVDLDVSVQVRPPAAVESAAYFVVAEALTNVARHADATRAYVSIARAGDRLVVEVRDDGRGGADASLGTGLHGLRDRVTALGGSMYVISPDGGPTTVSVELPCAS
jgi:signal transduction histidine kinase